MSPKRPPVASRPLLSLAMIVRDGGQDLVRCLMSVREQVDEIVVGDTGSRDGSPRTAQALGATVLTVSWRDDFAAARNTVLERCAGRWILVLDADEAMTERDAAELRRWIAGQAAERRLLGGVLTTRNYVGERAAHRGWLPLPDDDIHAWTAGPPAPGHVPTRKVRVFPNLPEIRFAGCVHETVETALAALGIPTAALPQPVHHWGWLRRDPRKETRYRDLAERKVAADPEHGGAWAELADARQTTGDAEGALAAILKAVALCPARRDWRLTAALALLERGMLDAAEEHLAVAAGPTVWAFSGTSSGNDQGGADEGLAECRHAQARIALLRGRQREAARRLVAALRLAPQDGHIWNTLGAWHLAGGRGEPARQALERARLLLPDHHEPLLNLGILHEAGGRSDEANRYYRRALSIEPACAEARRRLEDSR